MKRSWQQLLIVTIISCCKWQMYFRKYVWWTDLPVGWELVSKLSLENVSPWCLSKPISALGISHPSKFYQSNLKSHILQCCLLAELLLFFFHTIIGYWKLCGFFAHIFMPTGISLYAIVSGMALYIHRLCSIILGTSFEINLFSQCFSSLCRNSWDFTVKTTVHCFFKFWVPHKKQIFLEDIWT